MLKKSAPLLLIIIGLNILMVKVFANETLNVSLLITSANQRNAFEKIATLFENKNPGIKINYVAVDDTGYKKYFDDWLALPKGDIDVLSWQAGERLNRYFESGKLTEIGDLWATEKWDDFFTVQSKNSVSFNNKMFAMPLSYYQWGFYFKKSLFSRLGLLPPTTWLEFLAVCKTLQSEGITPIAIGTKNLWPAAAWFDYLNLRVNGIKFHQQILNGEIPYTDDKIKTVFKIWKTLIDLEYFTKNSQQYDWPYVLPLLYREIAGMTLIGNFVAKKLPQQKVNDIGFFRFPQVTPNLPYYEETPLDVLLIPNNSSHKILAKKFLAFVAKPAIQYQLNTEIGTISPNILAPKSDNYFIQQGIEILSTAKGFTHYYDRDTKQDMANAGIMIFAQFLISADIDETILALEKARQSTFFNNKNSHVN